MFVGRREIATVFLAMIFCAAMAVVLYPNIQPDKLAITALLGMIGTLACAYRNILGWPNKFCCLVFLAALLLVPATFIARSFGRVDMMAVIFHVDFGVADATIKGLESEALIAVLSALFIAFSIYALSNLWQLTYRSLIPIALSLLAINPFAQFLVTRALAPSVNSDLTAQLAETPLTPANPNDPDLVIIYLEGTDRQFADKTVWGNIYSPLTALASEGIEFTHVGQIEGTGWSQAGLVATQCGIPLLPKGFIHENNLESVDQFLPAITCLGDILDDRGYQTSKFVGSDLQFAGIDVFYETHKINDLFGKAEMGQFYSQDELEKATFGWTVDDQMVFDRATHKIDELVTQTQPFAVIVETTGPHGHTGFLSRSCTQSGSIEESKDQAAMIDCLLDETTSFIDNLKTKHAQAQRDRQLRIVVLSDHLSHNFKTPDTLPGFKGFNTVLFLGDDNASGVVAREGAMIDVFPTLLDWLGWATPPVAAGLGRSLLSEPATLVEDRGIATMDAMILSDATLATTVWEDR